MSAEEAGLVLLDDLLVSIAHEHNDVRLIHWRQVDMRNLHNVAVVDRSGGH
jgi:hypothetical protein